MKLYVVADMEGIAGVVSPEQVNGQGSEFQLAREQFSDEVISVCKGALEEGVEEIIVNDFHNTGCNIFLEKLPQEVMVVRGGFRSTAGYDFLDKTFGGLVLLGAHARSMTRESVLPHTYSKRFQLEIFGQPVGEFDILSLIAAEHGIPTIFISGDAKTIQQANTNLPATHTVITKYSVDHQSALCLHPKRVCESLNNEIRRALKNIKSIEPQGIVPPIQLVVRLADSALGDRLDWIPKFKRIDNFSFEFHGESMRQIAKIIYGITLLLATQTP